jgi:hypothetical protein
MNERQAAGVKARLGPAPCCRVSRTATVAGRGEPTSTQSPWAHRELLRQLAVWESALDASAPGSITELMYAPLFGMRQEINSALACSPPRAGGRGEQIQLSRSGGSMRVNDMTYLRHW